MNAILRLPKIALLRLASIAKTPKIKTPKAAKSIAFIVPSKASTRSPRIATKLNTAKINKNGVKGVAKKLRLFGWTPKRLIKYAMKKIDNNAQNASRALRSTNNPRVRKHSKTVPVPTRLILL